MLQKLETSGTGEKKLPGSCQQTALRSLLKRLQFGVNDAPESSTATKTGPLHPHFNNPLNFSIHNITPPKAALLLFQSCNSVSAIAPDPCAVGEFC